MVFLREELACRVVARDLERDLVHTHLASANVLRALRADPRGRHRCFDDEASAVAEVSRRVLEAPDLIVSRQQVEDRVVHQIDDPVSTTSCDERHVTNRDIQQITPGLIAKPIDHRT